jgi:hypothetical protein
MLSFNHNNMLHQEYSKILPNFSSSGGTALYSIRDRINIIQSYLSSLWLTQWMAWSY